MTDVIRFHLDENVSLSVASGLQRRSIDVTTSQDSELLGASDLDQLAFALRQQRVIFTQDADFLQLATTVDEHCGIVYVRKDSRSIREIVHALELVHSVLTAEEMRNHVEYL